MPKIGSKARPVAVMFEPSVTSTLTLRTLRSDASSSSRAASERRAIASQFGAD